MGGHTLATQRQTVKGLWRSFAETTSIHCVRYFVENGSSWKHRLFWVIVVLLAFAGLLGTVFSQVAAMLSFPTRLNAEVDIATTLTFPAVTICNINSFRRSEIAKYPVLGNILMCMSDTENLINEDVCTQLNNNTDLPPQINEYIAEAIRNMTPSIESTFMACSMNGEVGNCSDMFVHRNTEYGMCFTFNSYLNGLKESLVSKRVGSEKGLTVVLDVEQAEYVANPLSDSAGFKVILHDFLETPVFQNGFTIAPGFSSAVSIKMSKVTYLSSPYKAYGDVECKQSADKKLKYFVNYDIHACNWECKIDYIIRQCGCKMIFDPVVVPGPYCNATQIAFCYNVQDAAFTENEVLRQTCGCLPVCSQRLFKASTSLSYYPADFIVDQATNEYTYTAEEVRKNILELRLFYEDFFYEKMTQQPLYSFESISATLGGQMGLYLGISILSVVEILHRTVASVWTALSKVCSGNPINSKTRIKDISQ